MRVGSLGLLVVIRNICAFVPWWNFFTPEHKGTVIFNGRLNIFLPWLPNAYQGNIID